MTILKSFLVITAGFFICSLVTLLDWSCIQNSHITGINIYRNQINDDFNNPVINKDIPVHAGVDQIFQDKSDNLWVGTLLKGLWEKKAGEPSFRQNKELSNYMSVTEIFQDKHNNLWVNAGEALWEKKADADSSFRQRDEFNQATTVLDINQDKEGNLFVGTENGLWEKKGTDPLFIKNSQLADKSITKILQDSTGNIWIGTLYLGLWKEISGKFKQIITKINNQIVTVTQLLQDKNKNLWCGTIYHGLLEQKEGSKSFQPVPSWLSYDLQIENIYQDRQKNLWVGTTHGLSVKKNNESPFNEIKEIPQSSYIRQIYEDQQSKLFVVTENNGLWSKKVNQSLFKPNIIASSSVTKPAPRSEDLWQQIKKQKNGKLSFVRNIDKPEKSYKSQTTQIKTENERLQTKKVNQQHVQQKKAVQKTQQTINLETFLQDKRGNIWIGSMKYLFEIKNTIRNKSQTWIYIVVTFVSITFLLIVFTIFSRIYFSKKKNTRALLYKPINLKKRSRYQISLRNTMLYRF